MRVFVAAIILLTIAIVTEAAPRPATLADKAKIEAAGLTYRPGMWWDPESRDVGADPAAAKQFLKSLPRGWAGSSFEDCHTYEDKNIDRLNGEFAVCAAKFLKAYMQQHGVVTITSAYRDPIESQCVCKEEKGMCGFLRADATGRLVDNRTADRRGLGHQYGKAIDVWPFTPEDVLRYSEDRSAPVQEQVQRFHDFARSNPQFGVHFPFGMKDRPHLEPLASCASATAAPPPDTRKNGPDPLRSLLGTPMPPPAAPAQPPSSQKSAIQPGAYFPSSGAQATNAAGGLASNPSFQPIGGDGSWKSASSSIITQQLQALSMTSVSSGAGRASQPTQRVHIIGSAALESGRSTKTDTSSSMPFTTVTVTPITTFAPRQASAHQMPPPQLGQVSTMFRDLLARLAALLSPLQQSGRTNEDDAVMYEGGGS